MSILKSVFCGTEGSYDVAGIQVNFTNKTNNIDVFGKRSWFGRRVESCLGNSAFRFLTFGYLHVFIHEMGHALMAKLQNPHLHPKVNVYTKTCQGDTTYGRGNMFVTFAGPLAGTAFEIVKLVGAIALAILLPSFIGLPLGLFIGTGASIWIFGELMYALSGQGDWSHLTMKGST